MCVRGACACVRVRACVRVVRVVRMGAHNLSLLLSLSLPLVTVDATESIFVPMAGGSFALLSAFKVDILILHFST